MRRAAAGLLALAACYTVEARPRSRAPINDCTKFPCERYERGGLATSCDEKGLCTVERPQSSFYVVVHIPQTSSIGAGLTFAVTEKELRAGDITTATNCDPPSCLLLPRVALLLGSYRVSTAAAALMASEDSSLLPARELSIPVRAALQISGRLSGDPLPRLPFDELYASSQLVSADGDGPPLVYSRPAAQGIYTRYVAPQDPYAAVFPPLEDPDIALRGTLNENIRLCAASETNDTTCTAFLDHPDEGRTSVVTRTQGLDGFRIWLEDDATKRRISVVRELSGTTKTVVLQTSGRRAPDKGLDNVNVVIEPPLDSIAVPRFVSGLIGGSGLGTVDNPLNYLPIPPPVSVTGSVAPESFLPFAARVTLRSKGIYVSGTSTTNTLLKYDTTVVTNEEGRFTTVLPPGEYNVSVEGLPGTGYGRKKTTLSVLPQGAQPFLVSGVPLLTRVRGRALLSDGRPLVGAEVLAQPAPVALAADAALPRPGRSLTDDDGYYVIDLDAGTYDVSVIPQDGSGFPWVVIRREIPVAAAVPLDVSDVQIPLPSVLEFEIRQRLGESILSSAPGAVVRIFRRDKEGASNPPVEIGRAKADARGRVEILLAE